jgi:hypothetical protein
MKIGRLLVTIRKVKEATASVDKGSRNLENLSRALLSDEENALRDSAVEHAVSAMRQGDLLLNALHRRKTAYDKAVSEIEA